MREHPPIEVTPEQWQIIRDILREHVPEHEVRAFGSRATWTAKPYSDLDLVVMTEDRLPVAVEAALLDAFVESDLPWKVDLADWSTLTPEFRRAITEGSIRLRPAAHSRGWETKTFGDLIAEGAIEIGDGYRAKNVELGGGGLPFLRAAHVRDWNIDFEGVDHLSPESSGRAQSKVSSPDDTVVTTKGNSTGRTAFVTDSMPSFVYSPHLSYWRSKDDDRVHPRFLQFWSRSPEFSNQLAGLKGSTDMAPYLSLVDQRRLRITLPTVGEQAGIVAVLAPLLNRIALNREMAATLEGVARRLFRSWFIDFDPVRAKTEGRSTGLPAELTDLLPRGFVTSAVGLVPAGWQALPLDEVADFQNGLALQRFRPEPGEGRLPVVKIAQLREGKPSRTEWARDTITPSCIIDDGDLVFSWSGSLIVRVWTGGPAALNQHLFKVTSDRYPQWFYHWWVLYHLSSFQRAAAGKATTMGHINRRQSNVPPNTAD